MVLLFVFIRPIGYLLFVLFYHCIHVLLKSLNLCICFLFNVNAYKHISLICWYDDVSVAYEGSNQIILIPVVSTRICEFGYNFAFYNLSKAF